MSHPSIFANKTRSIPLYEEVAALLKKKFDLYGKVGSFPLTQDHVEMVQFQLGCQGVHADGTKTRDQSTIEFLQSICDVSATKIPDPHSLYPDFEKMTIITLPAAKLGNIKQALQLMLEEIPPPHAEFARC